jgi:hypothetical protein
MTSGATSTAPAGARIVALRLLDHGPARPLGASSHLSIGSDPVRNDLVVEDPFASRVHCVLRWHRDELVLEDLGSRNGTFVNGRRVERCNLVDGNVVQIGATRYVATAHEHARLRQRRDWVVGEHPAFRRAVREATASVATGPGVIVVGEQGSGRTLLTHAVHDALCGAGAPFRTIGPSQEAVPLRAVADLCREAATGIIHVRGLDAMDDRGPARQCLAQLFEGARNREFHLVISATEACRGVVPGDFRVVRLPFLADRGSDLRLLMEHFHRQALGPAAVLEDMPRAVLDALLQHPWPGSVAELRLAVHGVAALLRTRRSDATVFGPPAFADGSQGNAPLRVVDVDRSDHDAPVRGGDAGAIARWLAERGIPVAALLHEPPARSVAKGRCSYAP